MIIGVGIDLVQNLRIKKALTIHKINFLNKILTKEELDEINKKKISIPHLAGIFVAKEAVIKSLSNFLGFSLNFQEITIKKNANNVPIINIRSQRVKDKLSNINLAISISHEKHSSIALAVAEVLDNKKNNVLY